MLRTLKFVNRAPRVKSGIRGALFARENGNGTAGFLWFPIVFLPNPTKILQNATKKIL